MKHSTYFLTFSFLVVMFNHFNVIYGQPLVPALFIFGDSVFDAGNNNNRFTIIKSNFPPYGRDFNDHMSTGRFSNGKLAIDFTAENLGFTTYPPAYLDLNANATNFLNGVNFASGAAGYYDATSVLYNAISLNQQLQYYKDCQKILEGLVGKSNVSSIVSGAINLISAGSSDFIQNYYINPLLHNLYTPDQFSDILMQQYTDFIKNLYASGARRVGVTTLPPLGCLPAAITLFGGFNKNDCVERLNNDAVNFNNKLNTTSQNLQKSYSDLKLVVLDIYQPLLDLVTKPAEKGFSEARRACCGTGLLETSLLCNKFSIGTCKNATEYVFWDGFHPSEAANKILAADLLVSGGALITPP